MCFGGRRLLDFDLMPSFKAIVAQKLRRSEVELGSLPFPNLKFKNAR